MNRIGRRSFVGNGAVMPVGSSLGDECLLGCSRSRPPRARLDPDGTEWLGSPPFRLTYRVKVGSSTRRRTYLPTRRCWPERALIDGLRILIPGYVGLASLAATVLTLYLLYRDGGLCVVGGALTCGGARIRPRPGGHCRGSSEEGVMGTFKPGDQAAVVRVCLAQRDAQRRLRGHLRSGGRPLVMGPRSSHRSSLMGCRVGRHSYIETTLFSEFDLVEIGDYAALNPASSSRTTCSRTAS